MIHIQHSDDETIISGDSDVFFSDDQSMTGFSPDSTQLAVCEAGQPGTWYTINLLEWTIRESHKTNAAGGSNVKNFAWMPGNHVLTAAKDGYYVDYEYRPLSLSDHQWRIGSASGLRRRYVYRNYTDPVTRQKMIEVAVIDVSDFANPQRTHMRKPRQLYVTDWCCATHAGHWEVATTDEGSLFPGKPGEEHATPWQWRWSHPCFNDTTYLVGPQEGGWQKVYYDGNMIYDCKTISGTAGYGHGYLAEKYCCFSVADTQADVRLVAMELKTDNQCSFPLERSPYKPHEYRARPCISEDGKWVAHHQRSDKIGGVKSIVRILRTDFGKTEPEKPDLEKVRRLLNEAMQELAEPKPYGFYMTNPHS